MQPSVGRWLLLGTAVTQALSPLLTSFDGGAGDDPPVVPADYAFTVWGVVVLGCLAAAVRGLPLHRAASPAYRAVHVRLSLVQVGFTAWLLAATSSRVWLTVPIFAAMLALLLPALRRVLAARPDRLTRWLLGGSVGVYAGWTTAAVWVNLATVLPDAGLDPEGPGGTAWQSAVLVAACAVAVAVIRRLGAPLPYVATVAWAFVAVVVSAVMASVPGLAAVAVLGLVVVAVATVLTRRRPGAPGATAERAAA